MYGNSYGKDKEARDAAWRVLIDNDIRELPVSLVQIAKNNGITIVKDSDVKMLKEGESGMSIFENGKWYIVYNDGESAGRRRFTIAHELGHIFIGHQGVMQNAKCRKQSDTIPVGEDTISSLMVKLADMESAPTPQRNQKEKDADSFAVRLLAPACVLWGLNIHTAEEIQKICGLSRTAAEHRAKRMEVLYERNKFLTSSLERKVYENFKEWIERIKK